MVSVYFYSKLDDQEASDSKTTHSENCKLFFLSEELGTIFNVQGKKKFEANGHE